MINLLVALPAEAKPLNQYLGLKRVQPDGSFPIYREGAIQLVLCGSGRVRAAEATQSLLNSGSTNADHWINIGIAGHPAAALGELFQVNQAIDDETKTVWNLPINPTLQLAQANLITVNEPVADYPENALYDMEAAGLIEVLAAAGELERVVILKIVSDNHNNPISQINGQRVKSLINSHLNTLDRLLHAINC